MGSRSVVVAAVALGLWSPAVSWGADSAAVDARVFQVRMPWEDVTVHYMESKGGMSVRLRAANGTVEGTRFYVGDGDVAVLLEVVPLKGIVFQGDEIKQGDQFKKGSAVTLRPGFKRAADLVAGDVYVVLPGVAFEPPAGK